MPLPVPNLDDRTFDQLATEARSLIPQHFPAWTDHNPSDPGIALLELFAFLIESEIYRINRVPERSREHFAELVGVARGKDEPIELTLRRALGELERRCRTVTEDEFALLAQQAAPAAIARTKAVVETIDTPNVFPDEQVVKVIVVPNDPTSPAPVPTDALREAVFTCLRPRRLITTRLRVVAPDYTSIRVVVMVVRDPNSRLARDRVQENVEQAIRGFLSALTGGVGGAGWEFGRSVFRSELYQRIEGVAGVDHVRQLLLNGSETRGELALSTPTALVRLDELAVTVWDQ